MNEIISFLAEHYALTIIGAVTLVQIVPIKINPWTWLGKTVRHFLIGDIDNKLSEIKKKVDSIEDTIDEREAVLARTHILRFNDELYNGIHHSKEYFDQTIEDADRYDRYCDEHPRFKNSRTVMAAQNIKDTYKRFFEQHKF